MSDLVSSKQKEEENLHFWLSFGLSTLSVFISKSYHFSLLLHPNTLPYLHYGLLHSLLCLTCFFNLNKKNKWIWSIQQDSHSGNETLGERRRPTSSSLTFFFFWVEIIFDLEVIYNHHFYHQSLWSGYLLILVWSWFTFHFCQT